MGILIFGNALQVLFVAEPQRRSSWQKLTCFWWRVSQQFHKSLIIVKYHVVSYSFVTRVNKCDVTRLHHKY